ncbi:MAG: GNAT family N-acetyltransferase [Clostridia bacterium]
MSKAQWIWYFGDFEVYFRKVVENRRQEFSEPCPPFWQLFDCAPLVKFRKTVKLTQTDTLTVIADGVMQIDINAQRVDLQDNKLTLAPGTHEILIAVANGAGLPALHVEGAQVASDGSWEASCLADEWTPAGSWNLDDPHKTPTQFRLPTTELHPASVTHAAQEIFCDFGKETFGAVELHQLCGQGVVTLWYGESVEEARSEAHCETYDRVTKADAAAETLVLPEARAMRYVRICLEAGQSVESVSLRYEYLPLTQVGHFRSSDEALNQIWDTSVYTLHLNTREFMLDGIKRDRWVWSGDAYQSFLMNYYAFFDVAVNERTLLALRGKDPVTQHINTILDYSFYWFLGLHDYYLYTGNLSFVERNYTKMLSLMDFCLGRLDADGFMPGLPGDWVFVDWAVMEKEGALSAEQLLLLRSLEIMRDFASEFGDDARSLEFADLAADLKRKIVAVFWDAEKGGFINSRLDGVINDRITKHPNIFALLFDILDETQRKSVQTRVIQNPAIDPITTPYFRFYELAALCELGEQPYVLKEILAYWGGMLRLGATTFWEEFDPQMAGVEHLAMYDRPFGKSLCHAWGASPIYLLGKYYLGVKPLTPGFDTYEIKPALGGLAWIEGEVPMPNGRVKVYMDAHEIRVRCTGGGRGILRFSSASEPRLNAGALRVIGDLRDIGLDTYEVDIEPNIDYVVTLGDGVQIRIADTRDAEGILQIYAPYITDSVITFEVEVPAIAEFERRMEAIQKDLPWFVAEQNGVIVGYAYASHFRERKAYDWSVDLSVYVDPAHHGKSIGKALYFCLIETLKLQGYYNAYGGITMPNAKSEKLHETFGFREVANYPHVGYKDGRWLDVKWYGLALKPTEPTAAHESHESHAAHAAPPPPTPFVKIADGEAFHAVLNDASNMLR